MIRDFTTGKTKFVQLLVNSINLRGGTKTIKGGLTKKSALFETKKYLNYSIDIFDSRESLEELKLICSINEPERQTSKGDMCGGNPAGNKKVI